MTARQSDGLVLDDWAASCWTTLAVRPHTIKTYQSLYRNHLAPVFGHRDMTTITRREVQRWVLTLPPVLSAKAVPLMRTLYREANIYDLIDNNPMVGVKRPVHVPERRDFLTLDQVKAIDFGARWTPLFRFLAQHGLRWSECRALGPENIHDGYVWVTKSKTGRARKVPYIGDYDPSFAHASYKWARVRLRERADVTIHSLRKTFAYTLKTNGVHPTTAQRLLGHASINMTLGIYTDVLDEELDAVGTLLRGQA